MDAKTLSLQYLTSYKYFKSRKDSYELSNGKIVDPYFFVQLPETVVAVGINTDNEVLLVKQYRYPVNDELVELPGGFIDEGESANDAIIRELREETGYAFDELHSLGYTYGNPGVLSNKTHLFLALNGTYAGEQQLDANEDVSIEKISLTELKNIFAANAFKQSIHMVCVAQALQKLADLKTNS